MYVVFVYASVAHVAMHGSDVRLEMLRLGCENLIGIAYGRIIVSQLEKVRSLRQHPKYVQAVCEDADLVVRSRSIRQDCKS